MAQTIRLKIPRTNNRRHQNLRQKNGRQENYYQSITNYLPNPIPVVAIFSPRLLDVVSRTVKRRVRGVSMRAHRGSEVLRLTSLGAAQTLNFWKN